MAKRSKITNRETKYELLRQSEHRDESNRIANKPTQQLYRENYYEKDADGNYSLNSATQRSIQSAHERSQRKTSMQQRQASYNTGSASTVSRNLVDDVGKRYGYSRPTPKKQTLTSDDIRNDALNELKNRSTPSNATPSTATRTGNTQTTVSKSLVDYVAKQGNNRTAQATRHHAAMTDFANKGINKAIVDAVKAPVDALRNAGGNPLKMADAEAEKMRNIGRNPAAIPEQIRQYSEMTPGQKYMYNHLYDSQGRDAAEEYRSKIMDDINRRVAKQNVEGNIANKVAAGRVANQFIGGVTNSGEGLQKIAQWATLDNKKRAQSVNDYETQMRREKAGKAEGVLQDIASSTGNMVGAAALGSAVGGAAGLGNEGIQALSNALFGASQGGHSYQEAINNGHSNLQSALYAGEEAASEYYTEKLLGGIEAFGGGRIAKALGNTNIAKAAAEGINKAVKSDIGRGLLYRLGSHGANALGEAAQEGLQYWTQGIAKNVILGEGKDENGNIDPIKGLSFSDPEFWYSAALGAANSMLMNVGGDVMHLAGNEIEHRTDDWQKRRRAEREYQSQFKSDQFVNDNTLFNDMHDYTEFSEAPAQNMDTQAPASEAPVFSDADVSDDISTDNNITVTTEGSGSDTKDVTNAAVDKLKKSRKKRTKTADDTKNVADATHDAVNEAVDALKERSEQNTADSTPDAAKEATQAAVEAINTEDASPVAQETEENQDLIQEPTAGESQDLIEEPKIEDKPKSSADIIDKAFNQGGIINQDAINHASPEDLQKIVDIFEGKHVDSDESAQAQEISEPQQEPEPETNEPVVNSERKLTTNQLHDKLKSNGKFTADQIEYEITADEDGYVGRLRDTKNDKFGGVIVDGRALRYVTKPYESRDAVIDDLTAFAENNGLTRNEKAAAEADSFVSGGILQPDVADALTDRAYKRFRTKEAERRTYIDFFTLGSEQWPSVDTSTVYKWDNFMAQVYQAGLNGKPYSRLSNDSNFAEFYKMPIGPDATDAMWKLGYNKFEETKRSSASNVTQEGEENGAVRAERAGRARRGTSELVERGVSGLGLHGGMGESVPDTGATEETEPVRMGNPGGHEALHTEETGAVGEGRNAVREGMEDGRSHAEAVPDADRHGVRRVSGDRSDSGREVSDHGLRSGRGGRGVEPSPEEKSAPYEAVTPKEEAEQKAAIASQEKPKGNNFALTNEVAASIPTKESERVSANIDAINTMKNIMGDGRIATPEEQAMLAKYTGWGGIASKTWDKTESKLSELLTQEEVETAKASLTDAYYTSPSIIGAIYNGLSKIGFNGGRLLEPSAGTGRFIGAMPSNMLPSVKNWMAVELDTVSGNIAKLLYPNADVRVNSFEKTTIVNGYMDAVIGNVPFGDNGVVDNHYPKYITSRIHNYFIARSLDTLRPGGIAVLITSSGTLDAPSADKVRRFFMDRADLIGAVRLPNTAFEGTGTNVTSDILIFKKREAGTLYAGEDFDGLSHSRKGVHGPDSAYSYPVNKYFVAHPEMVLGSFDYIRNQYGYKVTVVPDKSAGSLESQIEKAIGSIKARMEYPAVDPHKEAQKVAREARNNKVGTAYKKDGKLYLNKDNEEVEVTGTSKHVEIYSDAMDIRDTAKDLLYAQMEGKPASDIAALRKKLNEQYDAFIAKNKGGFHSPSVRKVLNMDTDFPFLQSLERVQKVDGKSVPSKSDIFTKNTINAQIKVTHVDTLADGITESINRTGNVIPEIIAKLTDKSIKEVEAELDQSDLAFRDADGNFVNRESYLSGNVRAKLKEAEMLAKGNKAYQKNVDALKGVVPKFIHGNDISISMGVTWIPPEYYARFAEHLMNASEGDIEVTYMKNIGYSISYGKYSPSFRWRAENTTVWGTKDMPFLYSNATNPGLLWTILNNKNISVTYKDLQGKTQHNVNAENALKSLRDKVNKEFNDWVWKDAERTKLLEEIYNDSYNAMAIPHYSDVVSLAGQSAEITLRKHQAAAVNRIVQSPYNTLLQHGVGAGKTFAAIGAAMKLRQLGLASKPCIVVPKRKVADWQRDFLILFPTAKLLVADETTFAKANRKEFVNKIATSDVDAVIISHDQFEMIPMSPDYQEAYNKKQLEEILAVEQSVGKKTTRQLESAKKRAEKRVAEANAMKRDTDNVTFEETGIDYIFVDEAQAYKNLSYFTNLSGVSDMGTPDGSKRANDMKMKTDFMRQKQSGKGVTFLTATPIMNSPVEAYTMLRYLMEDQLEKIGIHNLDDFINMFGNIEDITRQNAAGSAWVTKTTFNGFVNMREWHELWGTIVDRVKTEDVPGIKLPKLKTGDRIVVKCQPGQAALDVIHGLGDRLKKKDTKGENHIFKIQSDGKKASFSQRMIDPSLPYGEGEKVPKAVDNIYNIWKESETFTGMDGNTYHNGTQLVFCDYGTPKKVKSTSTDDGTDFNPNEEIESAGVNVYQDMKDMLVAKGIPAEQIAFIHDFKKNEQEQLFDAVRKGEIRVLFGSSKLMGEGLNVQDRITAIHEMNPLMRPGDVTQAEGRAIRQGNLNPEVGIYVYVTEGTFDTKMWDALRVKGTYLEQIESGTADRTVAYNTSEFGSNAGEIMAIASGNPLLKEQADTNDTVRRLHGEEQQHRQKVFQARRDIEEANRTAIRLNEMLPKYEADSKKVKDLTGDHFTAKVAGATYTSRKEFGEAVIKYANKLIKDGASSRKIGSISGFDLFLVGPAPAFAELRGEATYRSSQLDLSSPTGVAAKVANTVKNVYAQLDFTKNKIAEINSNIPQWQSVADSSFEKQEELDKALQRAKEIEEELKKDTDETVETSESESDDPVLSRKILPEGNETQHAQMNDEGVHVGKVTVIGKPFTGKTPVETKTARARVLVPRPALDKATSVMNDARSDKNTKSFKGFVKSEYQKIFGEKRQMPVQGVRFNNQPYVVDLNGSLVAKVINDKNISPEKLAVIEALNDVVKKATFVGSGTYIKEGKNKNQNVSRYDYFETDVEIDGKPYVVAFDVEVFRDSNNYRTHKVINEMNLTGSGLPGPAPGALDPSGSIDSITQSGNSEQLNAKVSSDEPRPQDWTAEHNENSTVNTVKSISDVVGEIAHEWGFNIDTGKRYVKGKGVLGQYNKRDKGVRTRTVNDLPTLSHEFGHWLDDHFHITEDANQIPKDVKKEMLKAFLANPDNEKAYRNTKPDVIRKEGVAEFIRYYLKNKNSAASAFPKLTEYVLGAMDEESRARFEHDADEVNASLSLDTDTALSSIKRYKDKNKDFRTKKEKVEDFMHAAYQLSIDKYHAYERLDQAYGGKTYKYASNSDYADSRVVFALMNGVYDVEGNFVGDSLFDAIRDLDVQNESDYNRFGEFLIVRHADERLKLGKRVYANDLKNTIEWNEARYQNILKEHPEWEAMARAVNAFADCITYYYGVNCGLISQEAYNAMKKDYKKYVPMLRTGFKTKGNPLKKAKGSGRDIINPIDSLIQTTAKLMQMGIRNNVLLQLRKEALDGGVDAMLMTRIPTPEGVNAWDASQLMGELKQQADKIRDDLSVKDGRAISDDEMGIANDYDDAMKKIIDNIDTEMVQFTMGRANKQNQEIVIMVDGKPEFWKINDKMLYDAITSGMDYHAVSMIGKVWDKTTRFVTAATTGWNVKWSLGSNSPRDFMSMTVTALLEDKNMALLYKGYASSIINSIKHELGQKTSDDFMQFLAMGGEGTAIWTGSKNYVDDVAKLMKPGLKNRLEKSLTVPQKVASVIMFVSEMIERAPRYAAFYESKQTGGTPAEAFYESSEITTNFRRGGQLSKEINHGVPFFNATVQGIDRKWRALHRKNKKKLEFDAGRYKEVENGRRLKKAAKGMLLYYVAFNAILAAIEYALNNFSPDKDEQEKKRNDWQMLSTYIKNNYFMIPIGDGKYWSIPKPQGLAILESAFARSLDRTIGQDDHAFEEFASYFFGGEFPPFISSILEAPFKIPKDGLQKGFGDTIADMFSQTGVLGTMVEVAANRDYLGRPIESENDKNVVPAQRYNQRTSALAYNIGKASAKIDPTHKGLSPKMIDHVGENIVPFIWKDQRALFPIDDGNGVKGERDFTLGMKNTYIRDNTYSNNLSNWIYDKAEDSKMMYKSYHTNEQALESTLDSNMKSYYQKTIGLAKGQEDEREIRRAALDKLKEYRKESDHGVEDADRKAIYDIVESNGNASILPGVMDTSIKSDGKTYDLSGKEYMQYQDAYESYYYDLADDYINPSDSEDKQSRISSELKQLAREQAMDEILSKKGIESGKPSKLKDWTDSGYDAEDYFSLKEKMDAARVGKDSTDDRQKAVKKVLRGSGLSEDAQKKLWEIAGYNASTFSKK